MVFAREKCYQTTEASMERERERESEGARLVVLHKRLFKARNEENGAIGGVLK